MHRATRRAIHSDDAPAAIGTYSQAVEVGGTVYLSGQIPLDPSDMSMVGGSFEDRVRRVFENLRAVCRAAGGDLEHVVKFNVYLTDLSGFATVNAVMEEYLEAPYPARAAVQVAALPKAADVEVDAVMVLP